MPISINPRIAQLQGAWEAAGIIQPLDSDGVIIQREEVDMGVRTVDVPVDCPVFINGQAYTGNSQPTSEDPPVYPGEVIPVVDGGDSV